MGWYTPTSGIWQTVWLESRPKAYIVAFAVTTQADLASVSWRVGAKGLAEGQYTISVRSDDPTVGQASVPFGRGTGGFGLAKPFPGADTGGVALMAEVREPKLWTPDSPHLYDVTLELKSPDGEVDTVKTYFGLRTISRGRQAGESFERVLLNGKPIYLRGALDQSFNPKGIYTAPSDAFLKHDIELAKSFNLNFLRIHIKPDEPRRLYWADKLGMMIMEDMPNTWRQNDKARKAWEATMRQVVSRDMNHPAIFAWVDFNETWGLDHPNAYKQNKDTQAWVKQMVAETRRLDPTRLVEDNSPCYYDHVQETDLNSWHFYIDDHASAWKHIDEVVAKTEPGSSFNHCPGETTNTAPLINSEYGAVSAGSGDRDISWGFRDLTTGLRKHAKIQGYIYTELDDIEWEHNGFVNYDRTPKEFGYDAFVLGMTVADLQGPDFIGYDSPPAIIAKAGQVVRVPLFVSHYSDRKEPPTLRWWITGVDGQGQKVELEQQTRPVTWAQYGVTEQKSVAFKITPGPFVGALALVLEDSSGKRIAANFVNVVIKPEQPQPRIERRGPREVTVRFAPGDYARQRWSGPVGTPRGKVYGQGEGSFTYRLKLPEAVLNAKPQSFELMFEASAKAGRERLDWPERTNRQDYPQTDERKWPSTVELSLNGQRAARFELSDDPADARGVLSHVNRFEHGSYGEIVRIAGELPSAAMADLAAGIPFILRFTVPAEAEHKGGLCLFGSETGAYPFDPTLIIRTAQDLPDDLGVKPDQPVAADTASSRQVSLIGAGDSGGAVKPWAYVTEDPGAGWMNPDFDDKAWRRGAPGFGAEETPAIRVGTRWTSPSIWLRTQLDLPKLAAGDRLMLHLFHDEDVNIYINGQPLHRARGFTSEYQDIPLTDEQKALFHAGLNTIAVNCHQTGGGQGIDLGLILLRE
ncbi:MAG TPA: glycoside hydrolase family 2 TIM barrel-domain containing protein [Isosphaeraceae bacterium]|nr:glycoside hydrolase family 2 TIM barrel-domain containing protein [Isosphaeraceae bacterium]